jgi:hypothetical protein
LVAGRLLLRTLGGLDHENLATAEFLQQFQKPGIHATDLKDRQEAAVRLGFLGKIDSEAADQIAQSQDLQGYHLIHWTAGGMTYWAVSDLAPSGLMRFVHLIQQ